jgi:Ni,Fe-hydrogenase maturation factor
MRGQDLMLVVDACRTGGDPGEIQVEEMNSKEGPATCTGLHQIGPLETFAIAAKLFPKSLPVRTLLITVETEGVEENDMQKASRRVVSIIDREVVRCLAKSGENVKVV